MPIKPHPQPRHNRRHQRNPALLAAGRNVFTERLSPSSLTPDQLLAVAHYLDDQITLPNGGLVYKKQVREEKKRRGL